MQPQEQPTKDDFLVPMWTIPRESRREGHTQAFKLFDELDLGNSRKGVTEARYHALCSLLVGVNSSKQHLFRLSQNKNEYSIQQYPIGWRAMMHVQQACIDKGWLVVSSAGDYSKRIMTVLQAPEGSPLIVGNLFPVARLPWNEPVIQVKLAVKKNGEYVSNNIDVEWHSKPSNRDFVATYLKPQVEHLNALARQHDCDLGHYEFTQWVRKFRGGLVGCGGRLYDEGYQSASGVTRLSWSIDGEAVAELDITACGPTILACMNGQQALVEGLDPYQIIVDNVPSMTRKLAKKICQIAIGNDKLSAKTWPKSIRDDQQFNSLRRMIKWKTVRQVIAERLPYLLNPQARSKQALDIQFVESNWLMKVMKELLEVHGVGCLPVHESLIVPRSKVDLTKEVMARHFKECFGVVPLIDVSMSE